MQARVLDGAQEITCRPAELIDDEFESLKAELQKLAAEKNITLADEIDDDVLIYALFPQIGLKFLENRNNPDAFEPAPGTEPEPEPEPTAVAPVAQAAGTPESYSVRVNGQVYQVEVAAGGDISNIAPMAAGAAPVNVAAASSGEPLNAPLSGNIFKVLVQPGQQVEAGEVVIILEAMKMETEIRAVNGGVIGQVSIKEGDSVTVGQLLMTIG